MTPLWCWLHQQLNQRVDNAINNFYAIFSREEPQKLMANTSAFFIHRDCKNSAIPVTQVQISGAISSSSRESKFDRQSQIADAKLNNFFRTTRRDIHAMSEPKNVEKFVVLFYLEVMAAANLRNNIYEWGTDRRKCCYRTEIRLSARFAALQETSAAAYLYKSTNLTRLKVSDRGKLLHESHPPESLW